MKPSQSYLLQIVFKPAFLPITVLGLTVYDRRSIEADHRLSVLRQIATPVWQIFPEALD